MIDSTFDFNKMICFSLYSTANSMVRDYSVTLKKLGATYPQLLVLIALWGEDNITITQLSEITLFDQGTLTLILKRMDESDFISIGQKSEDRRKKYISLTKKGREFKAHAYELFDEMKCQISLTNKEQKNVLSACEKIRTSLSTKALEK